MLFIDLQVVSFVYLVEILGRIDSPVLGYLSRFIVVPHSVIQSRRVVRSYYRSNTEDMV